METRRIGSSESVSIFLEAEPSFILFSVASPNVATCSFFNLDSASAFSRAKEKEGTVWGTPVQAGQLLGPSGESTRG